MNKHCWHPVSNYTYTFGFDLNSTETREICCHCGTYRITHSKCVQGDHGPFVDRPELIEIHKGGESECINKHKETK